MTKRLAPKEYWKLLAKSNFDIDGYIRDQKRDDAERDRLEREARQNRDPDDPEPPKPLKYSYEILESERADEETIKKIGEDVKVLCGCDTDLVTDVYKMKIRILRGGKDGSYFDWDILSVRIRETWFVLKDGKFPIDMSREIDKSIVVVPELPQIPDQVDQGGTN